MISCSHWGMFWERHSGLFDMPQWQAEKVGSEIEAIRREIRAAMTPADTAYYDSKYLHG